MSITFDYELLRLALGKASPGSSMGDPCMYRRLPMLLSAAPDCTIWDTTTSEPAVFIGDPPSPLLERATFSPRGLPPIPTPPVPDAGTWFCLLSGEPLRYWLSQGLLPEGPAGVTLVVTSLPLLARRASPPATRKRLAGLAAADLHRFRDPRRVPSPPLLAGGAPRPGSG